MPLGVRVNTVLLLTGPRRSACRARPARTAVGRLRLCPVPPPPPQLLRVVWLGAQRSVQTTVLSGYTTPHLSAPLSPRALSCVFLLILGPLPPVSGGHWPCQGTVPTLACALPGLAWPSSVIFLLTRAAHLDVALLLGARPP